MMLFCLAIGFGRDPGDKRKNGVESASSPCGIKFPSLVACSTTGTSKEVGHMLWRG